MNDVIQHFEISNQHIQEVSLGKGNWLVLKDATKEEQEEIIKNYRLPQNIFVGGNHAEEVSRLEPLENTALNNSYALGVTNLSAEKKEQIEERLEAAKWELSQSTKYDCIFVNDELGECVREVEETMRDKVQKRNLVDKLLAENY